MGGADPERDGGALTSGAEDSQSLRWASIAHWVAVPTLFIGPLVVLMSLGPEDARVARAARESLNFEITLALGYLLAGCLTFARVGWGLFLGVWLFGVILHVAGARREARGRPFTYPFSVRIVRE